MRTVQKHSFDIKDGLDPVLQIPGGGHFLFLTMKKFDEIGNYVDPDRHLIDTWWAVETTNELVDVQLHIREDGAEVPPSCSYLGTVFPPIVPPLTFHVWNLDRNFVDMEIVDGKFVPKSQ